jgi:polyvinyl alcohol dehydrogenase (cytochrome)
MIRALLIFALAGSALAQEAADLYKARCAQCHDTPTGRVPTLGAIRQMPPADILQSLETGPMRTQAAGLTKEQRTSLVAYLAGPGAASGSPANTTHACAGKNEEPANTATWASWGATLANTRFQTEAAAGLRASDIPQLKVKWAFALGEGTTVRSQPAVARGSVFVASLTGELNAIDARSGCTQWSFKADGHIRTGITFAAGDGPAGRAAVYFGDDKVNLYAVDAVSGKLLWKAHVQDHPAAMLTGAPAYHAGVLYVPVSSYEEVLAAAPGYECCTFRGSVVALDATTGKRIWAANTIPQESAVVSGKAHGPSGAAVWSTPTFDEKQNVLYVATGDNYSDPPTATSDAVLALDPKTGNLLWCKQLTANDTYNLGSHAKGLDYDFGQPPVLVSLPNGNRALLIGQKSGIAYGLDPDRKGELLWQKRLGRGGPLGGIQWGSASDGTNVYVAVADLGMSPVPDKAAPQGFRLELDPTRGGGLFALKLGTGDTVWNAPPPSCNGRKQCSPAQSAAVTAIPGVVFSGSVDGHLRAYSTSHGNVLWDFDTVRDFDAVNGGKAHGGSIDVAGPVIAGGMLFVNSGYGQWGGAPGNVLLAFAVDGR